MPNDEKVQPGYLIDRDESGLTAKERTALGLLRAGKSQAETADLMGLSRARVSSLVRAMKDKGVDVPAVTRRRRRKT
jgi:biotin operon repressor